MTNNNCAFCLNHLNCDDLDEDNDFGSFTLECFKNYRIMLSAGGNRPVNITFEQLLYSCNTGQNEWSTVLKYEPDFCPKCGRDLRKEKEYYNKEK